MAAVGKPFETLGGLAAIPVGNHDVLRQAGPGTCKRTLHEIIVVHGIVMWVEHIGPDNDPSLRIHLLEKFHALPGVACQQLARRPASCLAGPAPASHTN